MLSMSQTATVSTTKEIKLKPQLRTKLLKELRTYEALHTQLKAIQSAMEKKKGVIGLLREETGEQSVALEGFKITLVAPLRRKFNKEKFVRSGGSLTLYNESHDTVPGRSYEKISLPGEKEEAEE